MDKKAKVKQELKEKTISEKLTYGESVTETMKIEPIYAGIMPLITAAEGATADLGIAKTEKDNVEALAKTKTDEQHNKDEAYDEAFTALGNAVDAIAKGDKTKIDKAGMNSFFPGKADPIGPMAKVANLSTSEGDADATIDLHWDRVNGAASFLIEMAVTNPTNFSFKGTVTQTSFTAGGLTSGTRYWFRVSANGTAGTGPSSDPATKIAP